MDAKEEGLCSLFYSQFSGMPYVAFTSIAKVLYISLLIHQDPTETLVITCFAHQAPTGMSDH